MLLRGGRRELEEDADAPLLADADMGGEGVVVDMLSCAPRLLICPK